jgi:triosephosphate isomerase
MRRPLIAGNWKMHMLNHEAVGLARQLKVKLLGLHRVDVLVCPPFTALTAVAEILSDTEIHLGAQNLHDRRSGAFTGEVSGEMIRSAGGSWVLIGHSERRQLFGDRTTGPASCRPPWKRVCVRFCASAKPWRSGRPASWNM